MGTTEHDITAAEDKIDLLVEFADKPGQTGVQYLLEVDTKARGAGSFPVSTGLGSASVTVAEVNYNDNLGNLSELSSALTAVSMTARVSASASRATAALLAKRSRL